MSLFLSVLIKNNKLNKAMKFMSHNLRPMHKKSRSYDSN